MLPIYLDCTLVVLIVGVEPSWFRSSVLYVSSQSSGGLVNMSVKKLIPRLWTFMIYMVCFQIFLPNYINLWPLVKLHLFCGPLELLAVAYVINWVSVRLYLLLGLFWIMQWWCHRATQRCEFLHFVPTSSQLDMFADQCKHNYNMIQAKSLNLLSFSCGNVTD